MDTPCIYIITALLSVLVFGCVSCAKVCSVGNLRACSFKAADQNCRFYKKELKCLEDIDLSTCADNVALTVSIMLKSTRKRALQCPGLPDGTCWYHEVSRCQKDVPFAVVYLENITEDDKKNACKLFKGKHDEKVQCYQTLKTKCITYELQQNFDFKIKLLENFKKLCDKYEYN